MVPGLKGQDNAAMVSRCSGGAIEVAAMRYITSYSVPLSGSRNHPDVLPYHCLPLGGIWCGAVLVAARVEMYTLYTCVAG